jgi:hypothetical protein
MRYVDPGPQLPSWRDTVRTATICPRLRDPEDARIIPNADIGNAANAYAHSYLPVVFLFSSQIDTAIEERYARAQWTILRGSLQGNSVTSSYVFSTEVLGYDLAGFFARNSQTIRTAVEGIIEELLR